jgi:hypothetical protein
MKTLGVHIYRQASTKDDLLNNGMEQRGNESKYHFWSSGNAIKVVQLTSI